ncbi:MAG: triple tyrosine motif-containing protein, partial [Paludibacter sp.]
ATFIAIDKGMEGQIWSLTEIDNTLFCGSDQGAYIISPNRIERITSLQGTWSFKTLRNHPDMILGCSYQGLFILKKTGKDWKFSHYLKGKFTESSPMFEEEEDGTIWFSHWQKGMYRLRLNANVDSITKIDIFDVRKGFPSNRNNTLFRIGNEIVFSSESGFYLFNHKTDKMVPCAKWNNLFASTPSYMRLHESKTGDVWCISGSFVGLAKKKSDQTYRMDSLTYRILQNKILAGFEHFNFIDNNNLILNTEDGFSLINTNQATEHRITFKVFIRNVIVNNQKRMSLRSFQEKSTDNASLVLNHSDNSLRFEFVAPEYRNEGLVQYSYMLENYDKSWSNYSNDNIKEYTQLPKGNYVFKVRARNLLESKEAVFNYSFTILPAWYESTIAIIIYALLFLISIFRLAIWVKKSSKKGALEMEQIKEVELKEQKKQFEASNSEKKKEIKELKNQQLQYELRHKSQELASSTMNLIRKNEMLQEIMEHVSKVTNELMTNQDPKAVLARLGKMERNIKQNIENDNNWKKFEENFDLVYENYLKKLGESYPDLSVSDKKLCAYLKMDLYSKDIAPLLNMSIRSVEMNRYRLRKKMGLERDVNLGEFLQKH